MTTLRWIITCLVCGSVAGLVQNPGWGVGQASGKAALRTQPSGFGALRGSPIQGPPGERHPWEKRYPFAAGGEIEVDNPRGRILVKEGPPEQVHLVAEGATTPVLLDDLKISIKKSRLTIKCVSQDKQRTIDLHLTIPSGVRLKLKAEEGTVQVHARVSRVQAETLSGDIVLDVPVEDLKIETTWREGYIRYGGPELHRITAPAAMTSSSRGPVLLPAMLAGQIGQGRIQLSIKTLNGWVEIGQVTTSGRVVIGAAPPPPLSRAARAIARRQQSFLSAAIRTIEPRLERVLEPSETPPVANADDVIQLESLLVNLNASVTTAEGKAISGLAAKDFTITEDGVKQRITHFATDAMPFSLVLLLDVSGSTKGKIDLIKQAALRFIDLMHPSDKIAVLLFARDVEVVTHLTSNRQWLRRAVAEVKPPLGSTALYDAIAYALVEELGPVRGERNAVVVITDGRDSSMAYADTPLANDPLRRPGSFLRFNDLLAGVLQLEALVYPIAIENETELAATLIESARSRVHAETHQAQEQLQQLAEASGGRFYRAAPLEALDGVYEQIAADLRTIYSLAYMPTRTERDGSWRRVEVSISRPGARVRCPRGYFAR